MLKVQLLRKHGEPGSGDPKGTPAGILVGFKVLGHAGFGEHGQDIVCAGVSALAQGALLGLQDVLGNQVSYCRQPGYLEASVVPEDAAEDAPRAILRTLELGLLSIAKAYSGYVEVTYQGVD